MALPQILADDRTGYGSSVPQVIGTARVPARCVFLADKRKMEWARGPLGDVAAAQLALCEGPITSVSKVWLDGKLEDATSVQATLVRAVRFALGGKIKFQDGTVPADFTVGKVIKVTGSGLRYGVDYPFDTLHKISAVGAGEITVGDPNGGLQGNAWDWADLFDAPLQTQTAIVTPVFHYARSLTAATDALCGKDQWAEIATGAAGQLAWSYLSKYAAEYQVPLAGTTHLRFPALIMPNGGLPDVACEVIGNAATGDGVSPGVAVKTLLARRLAASEIITDVGADGLAASSFDRYCAAQGWMVSAAITSETDILESLANLLESTNAIPVPQGDGKLKIIPRGDQPITGNGVTYTPPSVAVALGPDDFEADEGEDPIEIRRTSVADTFGVIPVSYEDRAAHYERLTVRAPVVAVVDGSAGDEERVGDEFASEWIKDAAHAKKISAILARRSTYIRNTFIFRVSHKGALLEPGDLVSLSELVLGLVDAPARIVSIEEDGEGLLAIEAEEWSGTIDSTVSLSTQTADGLYGLPGQPTPTETSFPAETATEIARQVQMVAGDALTLAGSNTRVAYSATPPATTGLPEGSLWFSTDTTTACPVSACKGHTLDAEGAPLVGSYPHRGMYWPHRWSGTAWEDVERQALVVAAEIAAGAIGVDQLAANAVSANKITAGAIVARSLSSPYGLNLWPNGHSDAAPPAGASQEILDSVEFKHRSSTLAYSGTHSRRLDTPAGGGYAPFIHSVPCGEGESFQLRVKARRTTGPTGAEATIQVRFAGTYGEVIKGGTSVPVADLWVALETQGVAPAGTTEVRFYLYAYSPDATVVTAWFDEILAARGGLDAVKGFAMDGTTAVNVTSRVLDFRSEHFMLEGGAVWLRDTGWVYPPLGTGFSAALNGRASTRYRRVGSTVFVWVNVNYSDNANLTVFTLPAGYRPGISGPIQFVGGGNGIQTFEVYDTGEVVLSYGGNGNPRCASIFFVAL